MGHDLKPPGDTAPNSTQNTHGKSNTRLWLLSASIVVALLIVLLVLPKVVVDPVEPQTVTTLPPAQQPAASVELTADESDQKRIEAEQALQAFLRLQAQPDLTRAEIWSADSWRTAMATARSGDEAFGRREFPVALKTYQQAGEQLKTILDNREQTLRSSLTAGWQYLQDNKINEATAAFERVLVMQPDHQQAQLGFEQSGVREEVLDFVEQGQQAEQVDALPVAAEAYRFALQLDELYQPAQDALEVVMATLSKRAYQDAMGRALLAIDNDQFTAAEKALNEAARISPGDTAVNNGRQRLQTARRQNGLYRLRVQANQAVTEENWAEAAQAYRQALKIDPKASFAAIGLPRAQKRQKLHQQLDHYLSDTTRLYSEDPLANAGKLLQANRNIAANEPALTNKLTLLQAAVELATVPVGLLILSDNLTQVTIYKVGRLGRFDQKELRLRPGRYTVTGSRQGFRDVLKVINLEPGKNGQSLEIRSKESI